jgi:hypothetical protein
MSFLQQIETILNSEIENFIVTIAEKFKLDQKEITDIWNKKNFLNVKPGVATKSNVTTSTKTVSLVSSPTPIKTDSTLMKLSKSELVELCKSKGLKVSGSKQELVDRILTADENKKNDKSEKITSHLTKSTPTKKVSTNSPPVIKKLVEKIPSISIKRNKHDNYEHEETGFVFNNKTQKVYGRQLHDGSVAELTPEDIDICNKYKFSYYIPDNLDKKSNLKDVDVKELDDVDEENDVEEEELEDEEEYEEYEEEEEEEYYEDD